MLGLWQQLCKSISWHLVCFGPLNVDASGARFEKLTEPVLLDIDVLKLGGHVGILVVDNSHSLKIVAENCCCFCVWEGSKLVEKATECNEFFYAY